MLLCDVEMQLYVMINCSEWEDNFTSMLIKLWDILKVSQKVLWKF